MGAHSHWCSAIKRDLNRALLERDGPLCAYCHRRLRTGRKAGGRRLTVDHVVPVSRGGTAAFENLVLACRRCNMAKGARELEAFLEKTKAADAAFVVDP